VQFHTPHHTPHTTPLQQLNHLKYGLSTRKNASRATSGLCSTLAKRFPANALKGEGGGRGVEGRKEGKEGKEGRGRRGRREQGVYTM